MIQREKEDSDIHHGLLALAARLQRAEDNRFDYLTVLIKEYLFDSEARTLWEIMRELESL